MLVDRGVFTGQGAGMSPPASGDSITFWVRERSRKVEVSLSRPRNRRTDPPEGTLAGLPFRGLVWPLVLPAAGTGSISAAAPPVGGGASDPIGAAGEAAPPGVVGVEVRRRRAAEGAVDCRLAC